MLSTLSCNYPAYKAQYSYCPQKTVIVDGVSQISIRKAGCAYVRGERRKVTSNRLEQMKKKKKALFDNRVLNSNKSSIYVKDRFGVCFPV